MSRVDHLALPYGERVAREKQEEEIEADVVDSGGRYSLSPRERSIKDGEGRAAR
jgi:hypothetical protein